MECSRQGKQRVKEQQEDPYGYGMNKGKGAEADLTGVGARLQELLATDRTLGFILNETEAPEGVSRECCDRPLKWSALRIE